VIALVTLTTPLWGAEEADKNQQKRIHFLLFGDWGKGTPQQKDVAEAMAGYADEQKATNPVQFVISAGDNFYEEGVSSTEDSQWKTKFEDMYDVRRLNVPFYAVLGNNDWNGKVEPQIAYSKAHPRTRWRMDGFWFKISEGATKDARPLADFFFVDTDLWLRNDEHHNAQLAWLREGLTQSCAKWKFVTAHHPLYSHGRHGADSELVALRKTLIPIFKDAAPDAYFAGHDHDLQYIEVTNLVTRFIISGGGGAPVRGRDNAIIEEEKQPGFYCSTNGFAAILVEESHFTVQFFNTNRQQLISKP
jgi:tartrate-resistant acid phosphatase type 5